MNLEKINFRESRDFSDTFNASFKFLRRNFKSFFLSLLFIAGPFILISAIANAMYQANLISFSSPENIEQMSNQYQNPSQLILRQFGLWYFIFLITTLIAHVAISVTVYGYIIVYQEKGPGNFTVSNVASYIFSRIVNVIAVFIVIFLLSIIIIGALAGFIYAIAMTSAGVAILICVLIFFGIIIVMPPIMWQISAMYLTVMHPGESFVRGFVKSGRLMRGNFWWTWLIVFCATLGVTIIGLMFAIPQIGYRMIAMMSGGGDTPVGFIIVVTVCSFMASITYSIMNIIFAVHYYSLKEKQDGLGMIERINEIGNVRPPDVNQHY